MTMLGQLLIIAGHRRAIDRSGAILSGDRFVRQSRTQRAQHFDLFIAHRGRVKAGRRLHRHQSKQLQHVVLDHVAQGAGIVIETHAPLKPDRFGDGNLDMFDNMRIPDRLEQDIGKAQGKQVLHRLLTQIMVDPEYPLFGEGGGDRVVDLR